MKKHWRTTLFGCLSGVTFILFSWLLWRDLTGQPKTYWAANLALTLGIICGISKILHGFHSADKNKIPAAIILAAVLAGTTGALAQEVTRDQQFKLRAMVLSMPVSKLQAIDALCPADKHGANIYFFNQITAASNTAAFLALSNTIATHR